MRHAFKDKLQNLVQLLTRERACARDLDMQGLQKVLQDKATLLSTLSLSSAAVADESTRLLIALVQRETRRNAGLYRSTRQTLLGIWSLRNQILGEQGYGPQGNKVASASLNPLISGKV